MKRVRVAEQGEDVEELVAKANEQHLDDDVEVGRCHKTWEVEDVASFMNIPRIPRAAA